MSDEASIWLAHDDLAGVVDLFGWLTRDELTQAVAELAYKRRREFDTDAVSPALDAAVEAYALVSVPPAARGGGTADADGVDTALAVGPAAFPSLPDGATDLPHILAVQSRTVDREALADAVFDRLSDDAVTAITDGETARLELLVDVTYDIEAWAPVDAAPIRERIIAELDGP